MKKSILLLFFVSALFTGCRKKTDAPSIYTILRSGTWKVDRYINNGIDQSALYKNWVFNFQSDNRILSVTDGVATYRGAWQEDEINNIFLLTINSPDVALTMLNLDWVINFKTPQRIQLRDQKVSPKLEVDFVKL